MYNQDSSNWSAFLAGAFIGAGIALLVAPQSGSELRTSLRDYASRAKDELDEATEQGRAAWDTAVERGQEYVEGGKQALRNAGRAAREFADEATQTAEKGAAEAMSRRG
jgi:gas vesicle protein